MFAPNLQILVLRSNGFLVNRTEILMTGNIASLDESSVNVFQKLSVVKRSTYNKKDSEKYAGD